MQFAPSNMDPEPRERRALDDWEEAKAKDRGNGGRVAAEAERGAPVPIQQDMRLVSRSEVHESKCLMGFERCVARAAKQDAEADE